MRRICWEFVLVVLVLAASTGPVVAQEATTDLPTCAPVTLEDLFPELYGPEAIPADDPTAEVPPVEEPPTDVPPVEETPVEETPAEEAPAEAPPIEEPAEPACTPFVYNLVYPVAGKSVAVSSFGADRSDHQHAGNDVAAASLTPVVAAANGRVSWVAPECCALAIRHDDGWTTWYIHLNNDTFGTDDGLGWGIAPGLAVDTVVTAGQIIGWVGDSGNAEDSQPHLHFELRDPSGTAVDPAPSLSAGSRPTEIQDFRGPFADDDGSPFAEAISTLTSVGLLTGCGDDPAAFCPDTPISGLEIATLVERITDLDITDVRLARSPEGPWQDRLRSRTGFVRPPRALSSCALKAFCTNDLITFEDLRELAALLLEMNTTELDTLMTVEDLAGSLLEQSDGSTPLAYCSPSLTRYVTNGEMAEMIARALGMVGPPPCDQIE
ncbi:MAG: peptidoglycan DD-metalloendopeptidase family protein [Acidimicrobiia bacterium]|nr:peptidoglycan DD-metalloendopeptidase family protein [Acidimicrobiia bacterium]